MIFFLVGNPVSIYTEDSTDTYLKPKKFAKKEIEDNLRKSSDLRLFSSLKDAREYANSTRIKILLEEDSVQKESTHVIFIKLKEYVFKPEDIQSEEVTVKDYNNFREYIGEHKSSVQFIPFSKLNLNVTEIDFDEVEFNSHHSKFAITCLPFFRALNPISRNSGITYCLNDNYCNQGEEIEDYTIKQNYERIWGKKNLGFSKDIYGIYNLFVGTHFALESSGGAKGILDFLILPLLARKLIADTYLENRRDTKIANALALAIAIPIELARFSLGIALTLLLSPIVAIIHFIKGQLPNHKHSAASQCDNQVDLDMHLFFSQKGTTSKDFFQDLNDSEDEKNTSLSGILCN